VTDVRGFGSCSIAPSTRAREF